MPTENTAPKQRGRPFPKGQSGNPRGRAKGVRNRATLAVEALLDGEAEALTRKAVALALAGDATALKLCLDRITPPRKDRPVRLGLPRIETDEDRKAAVLSVMDAVSAGTLSIAEGTAALSFIDAGLKAIGQIPERDAAPQQIAITFVNARE